MSEMTGTIRRGQQGSTGGQASQSPRSITLNTLGQQVVMDWKQKAVLDGSVYMVVAGTISEPITGDGTAITDSAAEMAANVASGTTMFPFEAYVAVDTPTGDDGECAIRAVATISTGTAFTPLPLRSDGPASTATANVAGTGQVAVTADLTTTTLHLHHSHFQEGGVEGDSQTSEDIIVWQPLAGPVLVGARSFYIQVAIWTYYAGFIFAEYDSTLVAR